MAQFFPYQECNYMAQFSLHQGCNESKGIQKQQALWEIWEFVSHQSRKISTTNHVTVLENCWLLNVELFWLSSFLGTTVSYGSFQGLNTRLEKQAKTTISNTQKPSTIGTSKLLLWDEIGRHFRWRKLEPYSAASQHNCEGASAINNAIPHNLFMLCKYH